MDFATLKLGADTSGLDKAEKALNDVAAAATGTAAKVDAANDKLDASFDEVGASAKQAATGVSAFENAVKNAGTRIPVANDNIAGMGTQSRLASHHVQNLAFQFQDLGVQLASGANPMTAFIQQGSQIAGIMGQAGIGVRGLIAAVAGMIAPFTPAIAIVGGLAAGVALMTDDINKNSKVTVTWTDTLLGSFDAIKAALRGGVDAAFRAFGTTTGEVWDNVIGFTRRAINFAIGAVVAFPRALIAAWNPIVAFADKIFTDVGNAIIGRLNSLMTLFGRDTFPLMQRSFADGGVGVGEALAGSIRDSMTRDWLKDGAAALSPYAQARARQRLEEDAKDAGKAAGKVAGEATVETLAEYIDKGTAKVVNDLERNFKFTGAEMFKDADKNLEEAARKGSEALKTAINDDLATFGNTMRDIADMFGGRIGGAISRLSDLIRRDLPEVAAGIGNVLNSISKGLGDALGQLGNAAQFGSAVGQLGTAIFGGNSRGAQTGGAVGGAAGSAIGGPVGQVIGSVLGSLVGGLIKGKNNFADVMLSGTGPGSVFNQRGGAASVEAGSALGAAFSDQLSAIAAMLGGSVRGGANFGSIGFSGEQFYFNAMGGDFKAAGAQRFASAEEAVAAAIKNAVSKGAFDGLTESSKVIVERISGLGADEIVKVLEQINAARNALAESYQREASAIQSTLERFQAMTAGLESFRASLAEQLMTAEEIYQAARARFDEISKAAIEGNEEAISQLVGVSQNYLDAAKNFLTPEEYNREIENVMAAVDLAIAQTKTMEAYAQQQLDALNKSVEGLLTLDQSVLSVADAIKALEGVLGRQVPPTIIINSVGATTTASIGTGPMATSNAATISAANAASTINTQLLDEMQKANEYNRELVKINHKQERDLQELVFQGEGVAP